jgi:hypothetical protein
MMHIATIKRGQWNEYLVYRYAVWVHRLARAIGAETDRLPDKPPPLPWPVYQKPTNDLRNYNSGLFPKFPVKPKRRPHLTSYLPEKIDLQQARTEVYRPEKGENFLWRIKICGDYPRPWEVDATVDPGGAVYLPFFREVTIKLPLKAKVCQPLKAGKDGRWKGKCRSLKKLNGRVQITDVTQWLLERGQEVKRPIENGQWTVNSKVRTTEGPDLDRTNHPTAASGLPLLNQGGELVRAPRDPAPAPDSRPPTPSPGLIAFRAKRDARARRAAEVRPPLPRHLDGALHLEGFGEPGLWPRYQRPGEFAQYAREREELLQAELEVVKGLMWSMPCSIRTYGEDFLRRDDFDGYLLTRTEAGPDPYEYRKPEPHWRWTKWGRRIKRGPTTRERLARVKPSARIVPTGPRSAELVITRRLHELKFGLVEALNLARMIEGAIKYRNPIQSGRKHSWRQQLRSKIMYRHGLLTLLVRNPLDYGEPGAGSQEPGVKFSSTCDSGSNNTNRHAPLSAFAPAPGPRLPAPYAELIDRRWLTSDGELFEATPGGHFATSVEGYRLRLPLAVMPPDFYERWLAKGGNKRPKRLRERRRARARLRRRRRGSCICCLALPIRRKFPNGGNGISGFS